MLVRLDGAPETQPISGGGAGGTSTTDDAAFTAGAGSGTPAMGFFSADTVDSGDVGVLAMDASRRLLVSIDVDNVGIGGGTQYDVDSVAGGTDTGTLALVVRDDALTTLTPADGDYTQLRVNSTGALHVTGGGGGTEYTEDVATANPIVGTATLIERDDALSTVTPVEGDWIGLRGSAEGALWVQDFNSDAILSDTTAILADTASMDTNIGTIAGAVSGTEMQADVLTVPAPLSTTGGGTEATALRVTVASDSTGVLSVDDGGGSLTVDGTVTADAGTGPWPVTDNGGSLTVDNADMTTVAGAVATDDAAFTAASGTAVPAMGFFSTDTVDAGDVGVLAMDASRRLLCSIEVDNVGIGGGTQYAVDDVGGGTDTGTLALVVRDDSLTTLTPADGDYTQLRVNSTGALHVTGGGGGTEYTEDVATANPIVGAATLIERDDALSTVTPIEGDWIGLRGSAEGALWVQDFNSDAILADTTAILADTASMDTSLGTIAGAVSGTEMQVDVLTMPSTAVTNAGTFATQAAATLQAGTAHAGTVEAVETPESVRWGGVVETKLDAFLNATSTGNTALVAAGGAGFKHVVLKAFIVNTAATSHVVHFESATTAITPNIEAGADGGGGEYPIQFETGDNEALNFNLTGAGTVGVHINYITVAV